MKPPHLFSKSLLGVIFLTAPVYAMVGQEPMRVSDTLASSHLLPHQEPVYPPIAKAAHVHGTVILDVAIDPNGSVTAVTVIDGPEMLQSGNRRSQKVDLQAV